jgi:two-component system chemotaxis response regulator CheY
VGRTALIVDDSQTMRQMVAHTLRQAGFALVEASNGQEGLARLAAGARPDVIITDINMPIMNGLDFLRGLRKLPQHRFTPALVLTTESQAALKSQGKAAGATGWLVKPFDPQALINVVMQVLP